MSTSLTGDARNTWGGSRSERWLTIDHLIEASWLLAILMVPLAITPNFYLLFAREPKYFLLHLIAIVILVAWVFEWTAIRQKWGISSPLAWAGSRPERWAVIAGILFGTIAVVSTLLSPAPRVSLWGRDLSSLGYELYTFLALLVFFITVAMRVRRLDQVRRILLMLMVVGGITAVYGIYQNFAWDPFTRGQTDGRNFASFGNAIFFGSFLVMVTMATLAVAMDAWRSSRPGLVGIAVVVLGLELAALWFTESKGPFLGMASGFSAFVLIGAVWLERRTLVTGVVIVAVAFLIAVPITLFPPQDEGARVSQSVEGSSLGGANHVDVALIDVVQTQDARIGFWDSSLELARTWETQTSDTGVSHLLRPLFGLGPEMFFYSYPLGVDVDPTRSFGSVSHPHNYLLHTLLELGYLGLVAFLALSVLAVYGAIRILNSERVEGRSNGPMAIFTAVVLAAMVGRAVEQMVGKAQITDLMVFWILLGVLISLSGFYFHRGDNFTTPDTRAGIRVQQRARYRITLLSMVIFLTALVAGISLFTVRDVRGLVANRLATEGRELTKSGQSGPGLAKFDRAAGLMPDSVYYSRDADLLLRSLADNASDQREKISLREIALAMTKRYENRDPFNFEVQSRLAKNELELGQLGRVERLQEAVDRYIRLADALRSYPKVQTLAAGSMILADEPELGLIYADRAIELETAGFQDAGAWFVRGSALTLLEQTEAAIAAYLEVIVRGPDPVYEPAAHYGLAAIYISLGETESARRHQELGDAFADDQAL